MTLNRVKHLTAKIFFGALFFLFLPFIQSCGIYTFSGANTGTAKTVSIQFIQNKANLISPTLSQLFTEKLKDKFIRETTLRLVDEDGDMQIGGTIIEYSIAPVALQGATQSSQNRLTVKSNIKFSNKTDEKLNFDEVFQNFTDFDANINFSSKEAELNEVVINMMVQDIFNKAVINW
jgi:hypothetical protein